MIFEGTDITVEDGCPSERILVISSDRRRFMKWCRDYEINPECENALWISNGKSLRKYANTWVVDLGIDPEQQRVMELYEALSHGMRTMGLKEIPR